MKDLVLESDVKNTITEDSTNNQTHECFRKPALIAIDRKKLETVQNLDLEVPVSNPGIQVSVTDAIDAHLKQMISQAGSFDFEFPTISNPIAESDRLQISIHSSKTLRETPSNLQIDRYNRTLLTTEVDDGDRPRVNESNEDDLINEVIDKGTSSYSNARTDAEQDYLDLKVKEYAAGRTVVLENSLCQYSSGNLTRSLHSSDYGKYPITKASDGFPAIGLIYIDNDLKEEVSENTEVPDYAAFRTQANEIVLDCSPESPYQITDAEILRHSSQSLANPVLQRNTDEDLSRYHCEADSEEGRGRTFNDKPMNCKAWSMQYSNDQPDADLESFREIEPFTGDELLHLNIEETAQHPRCNPFTYVEQMESDLGDTSCQPHTSNFQQEKIETTDLNKSLKRKIKTSEPQRKHASKRHKGSSIYLLHF